LQCSIKEASFNSTFRSQQGNEWKQDSGCTNLRIKRSVNIRAQYTFSITSNYSYLEPMDLVTITVPDLG
jgi:hypothetical protein